MFIDLLLFIIYFYTVHKRIESIAALQENILHYKINILNLKMMKRDDHLS